MSSSAAPRTPGWHRGRVASWLVTTDHKRIGILYIATALAFFVLSGIMAMLMRLQLAQEDVDLLGPDRYNELVTIHGTAMIFLVVVPILAGLGNFLVPLMIGARDVAFPRLNALSYWLFAFGGLVLMLSFFADGGAAKSGWTAYEINFCLVGSEMCIRDRLGPDRYNELVTMHGTAMIFLVVVPILAAVSYTHLTLPTTPYV